MSDPDFKPVSSSNIAAIAHDGTDLHVKFHNGAHWKYPNVSADTHKALISSPSVGGAFHTMIKKNPSIAGVKVSG